MYEYLEVIVIGVEDRRLAKEHGVLSVRVPSYWHCSSDEGEEQQANGIRTMIRYRVNPFVQRRVEFGDNVLLPLLADKPEQCFRFID